MKYNNGNATINIGDDGSRVIEYDDILSLDYPLNMDIRVSTQCSFGQKPDGTYALCSFCHESAKTDGEECDYNILKNKLIGLPKGIELAIGCNKLTEGLYTFIIWCGEQDYIVNLTLNQGHLNRDYDALCRLIDCGFVKGLGVSYRSSLKFDIPEKILKYDNTVFHVICGIDTFYEVEELASKGVKKVLILGEKDFGYNSGKVDLQTKNHKEWYWWVAKLFITFKVVSFDNLALEQLNIKRFFNDNNWGIFNQGEHSLYLDSINGFYHKSSRSADKVDWNSMSIKDYFKIYKNDNNQ